ncbi:complex I subunit 4 family protein [Alicyclobacillus contaminans]|uniref:complex I subunit 4 family protein n=1 Tax=Alicyclobacillus contaminans TaxID=392016 RepID=UPI0004022331|nr:NADH-quinone oxidoreductase subunit M [Alicyclobacillus contaminans]
MGITFWMVLMPILAGLLVLLIPRTGEVAHRLLALLGALAALVLACVAWARFDYHATGFQQVSSLHWFTLPSLWHGASGSGLGGLEIGLAFGVDGLSLGLVLLTGVIGLLAVLAARPAERTREYFFWQSCVVAGLYGVFSALNVFTFAVALELTLFAMFFLLYLFGQGRRQFAAMQFLLYRGLATVPLLAAFVGLAYGAVGGYAATAGAITDHSLTLDVPTLLHVLPSASAQMLPASIRHVLFLCLLLAVFVEEAFVPFHTWLPTAHEAADPATSMLLGGLLTKTGAYALLRFGVGMMPGEVRHFGTLLAVFGVINILYGAFAAWAQADWRRLIAFSSISHMGLVLLGIAAFNAAGLQGAMFLLVSSGLLTALLFFLVGAIAERTSTSRIAELGGLSRRMPVLSGLLLVAALGSLGLPLTSGFVSEVQAFIGSFGSFPAVSFVALLGVILSAVYLLQAMQRTTFGPLLPAYGRLYDASPGESILAGLLVAMVLFIGIYPKVIGDLFGLTVNALLGMGG